MPHRFVNQIIKGDCLKILPQLPDESVDLLLTDPPYGMRYRSPAGSRPMLAAEQTCCYSVKMEVLSHR